MLAHGPHAVTGAVVMGPALVLYIGLNYLHRTPGFKFNISNVCLCFKYSKV